MIDEDFGLPVVPEVQNFVYKLPTDIDFEIEQES